MVRLEQSANFPRCAAFAVCLVSLLAGCQSTARRNESVPQALPLSSGEYRIGCPDVLDLSFDGRPDWDAIVSVDVDGTLPLPESLGRIRAEGLTLPELKAAIAKAGVLDPDKVRIELADPRANRITISGPVNGKVRSVSYRGPEPVLELLKRSGSVQPGCSNLNRVYVVRPNVAAGGRTQVFHVDVDAVVLDGDAATNITVQPGDQVYVGETRRSSFSRLLPAWIRPLYRKFVGLLPPDPHFWWPRSD